MSKRSKNYQIQGLIDLDSVIPTQKTIELLDQSIKRLSYAQILTDQWFSLSNELEKISNVSSMEINKNSESELKSLSMGTNKSGTLWDTDKAQDSLRLLVEHQKLNILISLLKDLKSITRSPDYLEYISSCGQRIGKPSEEVAEKIAHFEYDAGLLLKRLFEHVEAIQACDLALLTEHIQNTLHSIIERRFVPDNIELKQEGLIFNYLFGVFHFIESLNEGQIVTWCRSQRIAQNVLSVFVSHLEVFPNCVRQKILETLGAIADCENLADVVFTEDANVKQTLVALRKECIRDLIVEFPDRRPVIRPFLDVIDKYEREIRFPKKNK